MTKRYLIVGLGKTGQSVLRFCKREQIDCVAFDTRSSLSALSELKKSYPRVDFYLKDFPEEGFSGIDTVVVSPGVPLETPVIQTAKRLGLSVVGDIEIFAQSIKKPVVAITGTNGKSTVTTMVGDILMAAGYKVAVCGNIGEPVLDTLIEPHDVWVLELSSFQLETVFSLQPAVGCFLNAAPDHLDRHLTFADYVKAKQRIYQASSHQIFNDSDANTLPHHKKDARSFGLTEDAYYGVKMLDGETYFAINRKVLFPVNFLKVKGKHNQANGLAALAITDAFGVDVDIIQKALIDFRGLAHRCQWIREDNGVSWVNDSKGTNVGATLAALAGLSECIKGKFIWIAGGQGKGADFEPLSSSVAGFVRLAILMGEDKEKIGKALKKETKIRYVNSMQEAVSLARQHAKPGDCVLLSPACASFDMFDSFVHRGDEFVKTVLAD
jgi:UDP-N-acetylmuramoylalanine--D-glutamate ligase